MPGFCALAISFIASTCSFAAASPSVLTTKNQLAVGRQLYRHFCGQCHALAKALSAGFGNNTKGVGGNGGPSFNQLRVPCTFSIQAVTEPTGGHELVRTKITSNELGKVATFIATETRGNPIPALPTDG